MVELQPDKKIAIMQPYIFPYLGYFQLINAVDEFVFYDDVNFIKQGWVNRNNILNNHRPNTFTVPLKQMSSFKTIRETEINNKLYAKWRIKFFKTLQQSYGKAPYYNKILPLLQEVLDQKLNSISEMAILSLVKTARYLDIETNFHISSDSFPHTKSLDRSDRLICITKQLNGSRYFNVLGGENLYDKHYFKNNGIELNFIKPSIRKYKQFSNDFIPNLSIIDSLMFLDNDELTEHLAYEIV